MSPTVAAEATPSAPRSSLPNALTVDVEDYFHVEAFAGVVPRDRWDSYPLRVVENTGAAGDVILLHPLVLHVATANTGDAPRFLLSGGVDLPSMWGPPR